MGGVQVEADSGKGSVHVAFSGGRVEEGGGSDARPLDGMLSIIFNAARSAVAPVPAHGPDAYCNFAGFVSSAPFIPVSLIGVPLPY